MQHYIFHEVKCLHWMIRDALDESLESMDLTGPQSFILQFVSAQETPPCVRDVEERLNQSHATVCGILNRLESKGFIALRPDEKDRRIKRLYLLPRAQESLQRSRSTIEAIEERLIRGFSPEEQEVFHKYLHQAIDNMRSSCCKEDSKA